MRMYGNAPKPSAYAAPGIWGPNDVNMLQGLDLWDPGGDPYWANVAFLFQPKQGDTTFVDRSPNAITLTATGSPSFVPGPFAGALALKTSSGGDFLSGSHAALSIGNVASVFEIVVALDQASAAYFFASGAGTTNWALRNDGFVGDGGGWSHILMGTWDSCVPRGVYAHLAVVRTAAGPYRAYANGVYLSAFSYIGSGAYAGSSLSTVMLGYNSCRIAAARITKGTDRGYTGSTIPALRRPFPVHS